jgi:hypothetical protein
MTRHLRPGLLGEGDKSSVIQCRKTPLIDTTCSCTVPVIRVLGTPPCLALN